MSRNLTALRAILKAEKPQLSAFVVPSADAHFSEYSAACFERRSFISGFTGSAGTAVVTHDAACLWTDGRYFAQAEAELSDEWTLMRMGQPGTPTIPGWLKETLSEGDVVGVDPRIMSMGEAADYAKQLESKGIRLHAVAGDNLVDRTWADQPKLPADPIFHQPLEFSGRTAGDKLAWLRQEVAKAGATHMVVTALDEVAWLLNLRGSDVHCNPVFYAFALLEVGGGAEEDDEAAVAAAAAGETPQMLQSTIALYLPPGKLPADVEATLAGEAAPFKLLLRPYEALEADLAGICGDGSARVLLDDKTTSMAVRDAVPEAARVTTASPIQLEKALKNPVELQGSCAAHQRDGVALTRFFAWLEDQVQNGQGRGLDREGKPLNEHTVSEQLLAFRRELDLFVGPSFDTIAGSGPNGAIIHYHAPEEGSAPVTADQMFLCDSGGQFRDGTTDTTRTVHFGSPSDWERRCFTRVLQGHIAMDSAVFPPGTSGYAIDALARAPLWADGLNYRHGTGHGVGSFLNVHEGPMYVGNRMVRYKGGLRQHMIVSDEPGYYEDGKFGIRIENLVHVVAAERTAARFGTDGAPYLTFEALTVVPISPKLVDADLMLDREVQWLNDYNAKARAELMPLLEEAGDELAQAYLLRETEPVRKAAV